MDSNILVSVNCITYNHEAYISRAIESFLMQQTNFQFEILIGEDCSTDNTRKIVENYVYQYPNKIRLVTSHENVGAMRNSERLFEKSLGKYIAICEGDDYWLDPLKLQKQVDYMEGNPECSLCFHSAKIVDINEKYRGKLFRPYKQNTKSLTEEIIYGGGEFCPTSSIIFPKVVLQNKPEFFQTAHVGDYPLQMWCASFGFAYYIDMVGSAYRTGGIGSWTTNLYSGENAIEKAVKSKDNDINLLNDFNKYTNYKYEPIIEKTKEKKEFEKLLIQGNLKRLRIGKYKSFYSQLSKTSKLKLITKFHFPKFYFILLNIKKAIAQYKNYGILKRRFR